MNKEELLQKLKECEESDYPETAHERADMYLLEYISDEDIEDAFYAITRWYA